MFVDGLGWLLFFHKMSLNDDWRGARKSGDGVCCDVMNGREVESPGFLEYNELRNEWIKVVKEGRKEGSEGSMHVI